MSARKRLSTYIEAAKCKNGAELKRVVDDRRKDLLGLDDHFVIELALLSQLSGDAATNRVKELIRTALPHAGKTVTLESSIASLQGLCGGESFMMLPAVAQSMLRFAVKLVSAIDSHTVEEQMSGNVSQFWKEIFCLLPFFLEWNGVKEAGAAAAVHRGVDAVEALVFSLSQCKGMSKGAKDEMKELDVGLLRKFQFACPLAHHASMHSILKVKPAAKAKAKAKAKPKDKPEALEAAASDAQKWFE